MSRPAGVCPVTVAKKRKKRRPNSLVLIPYIFREVSSVKLVLAAAPRLGVEACDQNSEVARGMSKTLDFSSPSDDVLRSEQRTQQIVEYVLRSCFHRHDFEISRQ